VLRDGAYVSGRWPGDMHALAAEFVRALADGAAAQSAAA